jgi:hypothetical protein
MFFITLLILSIVIDLSSEQIPQLPEGVSLECVLQILHLMKGNKGELEKELGLQFREHNKMSFS